MFYLLSKPQFTLLLDNKLRKKTIIFFLFIVEKWSDLSRCPSKSKNKEFGFFFTLFFHFISHYGGL